MFANYELSNFTFFICYYFSFLSYKQIWIVLQYTYIRCQVYQHLEIIVSYPDECCSKFYCWLYWLYLFLQLYSTAMSSVDLWFSLVSNPSICWSIFYFRWLHIMTFRNIHLISLFGGWHITLDSSARRNSSISSSSIVG